MAYNPQHDKAETRKARSRCGDRALGTKLFRIDTKVFADRGPIGFPLIKALLPSSRSGRGHVLALELPGLSK